MNANEQNRRVTWTVYGHNVFPVCCKSLRGNLARKCFYFSKFNCMKVINMFHFECMKWSFIISLYLYSLYALRRKKVNDENSSSSLAGERRKTMLCLWRAKKVSFWPSVFIILLFLVKENNGKKIWSENPFYKTRLMCKLFFFLLMFDAFRFKLNFEVINHLSHYFMENAIMSLSK